MSDEIVIRMNSLSSWSSHSPLSRLIGLMVWLLFKSNPGCVLGEVLEM